MEIKDLLKEIGEKFFYHSDIDGVTLKLNELEEFREFEKTKIAESRTEIEFLREIEEYCDNMRASVGHSILDDFNNIIKSRIAALTDSKDGGEDE